MEFEVGQVFPSKEELRKRVKEYIIRVGFTCMGHKNDGVRYTVSCDGKGCGWRLHASKMDDGNCMMIKTYEGTHQCVRKLDSREIDSKWLSGKIVDELRKNP